MMMYRTAFLGLALAVVMPAFAHADPPCGRGWRKGEYCGGPVYVAPPPVYLAPPPVIYAPPPPPPPPPVFYAPPPPPPVIYAPPPPVYVAPGLSIGINIPLH